MVFKNWRLRIPPPSATIHCLRGEHFAEKDVRFLVEFEGIESLSA